MAKRIVHWISLRKAINAAGPKGISMYDLAKNFKVKVEHEDFQHALNILKGNIKVKFSMGIRKSDNLQCQFIQIRDDTLRRSKRTEKEPNDSR